MTARMRCLALALLTVSQMASAADAPGSRDFDWLPRYPQAEIAAFNEQHVPERVYPLDSIRRISGRLRMSSEVSASGELTTITYQLPDSHTGIEAFERARKRILEEGGELLFWCEGRDCGSSSLWANEIFHRSTLYGPDARQAYLLARLADDADRLVALYGVTRGNGRPYLHVEAFKPDAPLGTILPNPATLLRQLKGSGELRLPRLPEVPTAEWRAVIANVFRLDSAIRVTLLGKGAAAWQQALTDEERIRAQRIATEVTNDQGLLIRLLR